MEKSTMENTAGEDASIPPRGPESAYRPEFKPEKRRLIRNLRSPALFLKIREAERRVERCHRNVADTPNSD